MLEPNEHVLTVIKRHFIGLVFAYLQVLAAFVALVALAAVVLPGFINDLTAGTSATLTIAAILLLTLLVLVLFLVTTIYWQNKLVLTDQALLQTLQTGPFHQKVSRLDMADIQDVTTEQKGLLPTIFNYGTLHVETAGELRNFAFKYTPDPSRYATMIIEARHNASSHNH
jgi:membrane protein YdbS with pleckstrin-like domain